MKKLQNKSLIRAEKTLIIACHKHYSGMVGEWKENVFLIESIGNALHRYNFRQREYLRHYIEDKGCRQILIVGHYHKEAIDQIMNDHSPESPMLVLDFNLKVLLGRSAVNAIPKPVQEQLLIETNIIQQCQLLFENDFIQEHVHDQALHVIGIVAGTPERKANPVFYNGISYNNLITLN